MGASFPLPEAFLDNMRAWLGDEYPAFLRALDEPAALALRLNPKRAGAMRRQPRRKLRRRMGGNPAAILRRIDPDESSRSRPQ